MWSRFSFEVFGILFVCAGILCFILFIAERFLFKELVIGNVIHIEHNKRPGEEENMFVLIAFSLLGVTHHRWFLANDTNGLLDYKEGDSVILIVNRHDWLQTEILDDSIAFVVAGFLFILTGLILIFVFKEM